MGRTVQRAGSTSTTAGYAGNEDPSTIQDDSADISCSHGGDGVKTRCSTRPRERLETESITRLSLRMFSFTAGLPALRCLRKVSDLCVLSVTPRCLCIRLEDGDPTGRSIIHTWDSANCFIQELLHPNSRPLRNMAKEASHQLPRCVQSRRQRPVLMEAFTGCGTFLTDCVVQQWHSGA